jgi:hypothetical protein
MKKNRISLFFVLLILIIVICLCFALSKAQAQEYYIENGIEYVKMKADIWEQVRDKTFDLIIDNKTKDTILIRLNQNIDSYKKIVGKQDTIILNYKSELILCNQKLQTTLNTIVPIPAIEQSIWDGFYFGYQMNYDSLFYRKGFDYKNIASNLFCEMRIKVNRFVLSTALIMPFKFTVGAYLRLGYKLF